MCIPHHAYVCMFVVPTLCVDVLSIFCSLAPKDLKAVPLRDIVCKCLYMDVEDKCYVAFFVNHISEF